MAGIELCKFTGVELSNIISNTWTVVNNRQLLLDMKFKKNKCQWKKSLYCWHKKEFRKKYLRQPSIDFDFCNISSSCDVVYKGHWLTQAGYWFILRGGKWNSHQMPCAYSSRKAKNYRFCPIRIELIHGRHRVVQIYTWAGPLYS
jgi:hypothetical protein